MPRTINLKAVIQTELREVGMIGSDPEYTVEILCRRGASPEFAELVRIVMPFEAFIDTQKAIKNLVNRQIQRADYLKGLTDDGASR
jgi:hypothetical protein